MRTFGCPPGGSLSNTKIAVAAVVCVAVVVVAVVIATNMLDNDNDTESIDVVYQGNGGSNDGSTVYHMSSETVFGNMFINEGMVFTGWNTAADGSGTSYSPGDTISPAGGQITLYAQWAYALTISETFEGTLFGSDLTLYIFDGNTETVIDWNGNALPTGGNAAITAAGPVGTEWTYDQDTNTFTGVNGSTTYTLTIELTGVDYTEGNVGAGFPMYYFEYTGPVHANITIRTSTTA